MQVKKMQPPPPPQPTHCILERFCSSLKSEALIHAATIDGESA